MLLYGLAQLALAMSARTLAQKIKMTATGTQQPVHRCLAIAKAKYFYTVYLSCTLCPLADTGNSLLFTFADTGRSNLYTVNPHFFQQGTGYHQLLVRHEGDTTRLLSIAQSGVHYFYGMGFHHLLMIMAHRYNRLD